MNAELATHFEKLGKSVACPVQVHDFLRRAGDDVRAVQLDGLGHPPAAFVQNALVLDPVRRDPAVERDHADYLQTGIRQGPLQLGNAPPWSR